MCLVCDHIYLLFIFQASLYPRILAGMKPGATLGLSHGFLLGVMKNDGVDFRRDINVVLVAPKVVIVALRMTTQCSSQVVDFGFCLCGVRLWNNVAARATIGFWEKQSHSLLQERPFFSPFFLLSVGIPVYCCAHPWLSLFQPVSSSTSAKMMESTGIQWSKIL